MEAIHKYDNREGAVAKTKAIVAIEAQYQMVEKEKKILYLQAVKDKVQQQKNMILCGRILFS